MKTFQILEIGKLKNVIDTTFNRVGASEADIYTELQAELEAVGYTCSAYEHYEVLATQKG